MVDQVLERSKDQSEEKLLEMKEQLEELCDPVKAAASVDKFLNIMSPKKWNELMRYVPSKEKQREKRFDNNKKSVPKTSDQAEKIAEDSRKLSKKIQFH